MENFENFRIKTAETIKNVPKEVRHNVLHAIKKSPEYLQSKELQDAKRGYFELSKTETLTNPENSDEVSAWIKSEFEEYTEKGHDYMMSYQLEDFSKVIVKYLAKRLNIKIEELNINDFVECDEETTYSDNDSADDGHTKGEFSLMGNNIFKYEAYSDGSSFAIENWNVKNLIIAATKLIEYLKSKN